jgi:hypothetical protein
VEPVKHFEAELDAVLGRAPEVQVPRNFRQRVMAQLPEEGAAERPRSWELPALAGLAALLLGAVALLALQFGFDRWLAQPAIFFVSLGVGTVVALAWLWRTVISG